MEKYLIALDLDGTLIPNIYDLSDYSVKVFRKIKELGHEIVITTGRPFRSSFFVYYKFGLDSPLINYNGGLISNPVNKNGYKVYSDEMPKENLLKIYNEEKDLFTLFFVEHYDTIYSNIDDPTAYPLMHHSFMSNLYSGDLNKILDTDGHGSLILAKPGCGKLIAEYVKSTFKDMSARIWSWGIYSEIVELFSLKSSKGSAITKVREELGFDKEHTIACGDSMNDIDFFEACGIKVTLSNGAEIIKKMADYVYPDPCEKDGIAKFFVDFFKLEI